MKTTTILLIFILSVGCNDNPDSIGSHWDYSIFCEGGYKYKSFGKHKGTIQMLNSDGSKLKCNQTRY